MSLEKITALGGTIDDAPPLPKLEELGGLGAKRRKILNDAGIFTVEDLALFLPRKYEDRREPRSLGDLYSSGGKGRVYTAIEVINIEYFYARRQRVPKIWIEDLPGKGHAQGHPAGTGSLLCFGRPFLAGKLTPGSRWLLAADFTLKYGDLQSSAFEVLPLSESDSFHRIIPRYPRMGTIPPAVLEHAIARSAELISQSCADDTGIHGGAMAGELRRLGLPDISRAIRNLHNPGSMAEVEPARRRLAYGELRGLIMQQRDAKGLRRGSGPASSAIPSAGSGSPTGSAPIPGAASSRAAPPPGSPDETATGLLSDSVDTPPPSGPAAPGSYGAAATPVPLQRALMESLPFELTADQSASVTDINADIDSGAMYRLLQGDVGSGKTLVALLAALKTVGAGGQAALMVPTEILARQHFLSIGRLLEGLTGATAKVPAPGDLGAMPGGSRADTAGATLENFPTEEAADDADASSGTFGTAPGDAGSVELHLLTAGMGREEQHLSLRAMAEGRPGLYIGTHSLFSQRVEFADLRLVIIDEQHRFGVNQRANLRSKAACDNLLMLSATPIPRTLTLTVFGGMDVSTIRHLPRGRKPIATHLAVMGREEKVYRAVEARLEAGEQVYFVYPRIEDEFGNEEDSGNGDSRTNPAGDGGFGSRTNPAGGALKSAEQMFVELQRRFPSFPAGLVHGRMGGDERSAVMDRFAAGKLRILVATTVIEVGVDVAAATAIVIEHAERFGLSALHQLRGRVGRGSLQSYCYLVYDPNITEDGKKRLRVMKESTDGFVIAEEDLKIRGPGNISGVEQSGYLKLEFASLYKDLDLIEDISRSLA